MFLGVHSTLHLGIKHAGHCNNLYCLLSILYVHLHTCVSTVLSTVNLSNTSTRAILSTIRAYLFPMQFLGPSPNGM